MVTRKTATDVQDATVKSETTANTPPPAASDFSALDALERQAERNEQAGQQEQQQAEQKEAKQEIDTLAADLLGALNMAAAPAQPAMWWLTEAQFEQLWGDKVRKGIANAGAEIMRRHGLSMGGLMSQYGPYVALAGALGPSVLGTVAIFKARRQEQIAQAAGGGSGAA